MRRIAWIAVIAGFALIAVGAAMAIGRGSGTEEVNATFEARAIGNPNIKLCRNLGGDVTQRGRSLPANDAG